VEVQWKCSGSKGAIRDPIREKAKHNKDYETVAPAEASATGMCTAHGYDYGSDREQILLYLI
jgi:hypothetical protein